MSTAKPSQHAHDLSFDLRETESDMSLHTLHTLPPYSTFPLHSDIPSDSQLARAETSSSEVDSGREGGASVSDPTALATPQSMGLERGTMTNRLSRTVLLRKFSRAGRVESTDGGSFFTARATLRSVAADGKVNDEEVELWLSDCEVGLRCGCPGCLPALDGFPICHSSLPTIPWSCYPPPMRYILHGSLMVRV